jgi:hypothetical protein
MNGYDYVPKKVFTKTGKLDLVSYPSPSLKGIKKESK